MSGCQDDLIELLTCEIGEKTKCVPADQSCWRQEGRDVEGASLISVPLLTYRIRMARGKIKIKNKVEVRVLMTLLIPLLIPFSLRLYSKRYQLQDLGSVC